MVWCFVLFLSFDGLRIEICSTFIEGGEEGGGGGVGGGLADRAGKPSNISKNNPITFLGGQFSGIF